MADLTPTACVAAVKDIAVSLLPISATPRERALLAAELARLSVHAPERIATIWNPALCPVELLAWLAWAVSVDVWDATWSTATKRAVIAAAPGVHRLKGTRAAVRRALDALRIRTDIVEWWETEPPGRRGTATVTAFVSAAFEDDGVILSERIQRQSIASIKAAKPKSRALTYRLGVGFRDAIGMTGALESVALISPTVAPAVPMLAAGLGSVVTECSLMAVRPSALMVRQEPTAFFTFAAGMSSVAFLNISMEARA